MSECSLPSYDDMTEHPYLSDFFARVLAGGTMITATTEELCAYIRKTPSMEESHVVRCIWRSELMRSGVQHEFLLLKCLLAEKGLLWLRLERIEKQGRPISGSGLPRSRSGPSRASDLVSPAPDLLAVLLTDVPALVYPGVQG
jgi:hypothetical protein